MATAKAGAIPGNLHPSNPDDALHHKLEAEWPGIRFRNKTTPREKEGHSTTETGRNEVKTNLDESDVNPCDFEGLQNISELCENWTQNIQWAVQDLNL